MIGGGPGAKAAASQSKLQDHTVILDNTMDHFVQSTQQSLN